MRCIDVPPLYLTAPPRQTLASHFRQEINLDREYGTTVTRLWRRFRVETIRRESATLINVSFIYMLCKPYLSLLSRSTVFVTRVVPHYDNMLGLRETTFGL